MAIDLLSFGLGNQSFKINSFNLGAVSTIGWAIVNVRIKLSSKLFRNQREDGSYIVDGRVLLPTQITVSVIAQSKSAMDTINSILKDRTTIYTINTRGLIFTSMVLQNENINQSADNTSSQPVQLVFRQILSQEEVLPQTRQVGDSSVIDRGIAYIKETTTTVTQTATKIASKIGGVF